MGFLDRFRRKQKLPPLAQPSARVTIRNQYAQASWDRTKTAWYRFVPTDVNDEFENNIENLRALSHRLSVEDVYTRRFLSTVITNVIGPKGILFAPKNRKGKTLNAGLNASVNQELIRAKKKFDKRPTVNNKGTFLDFKEVVLRTTAEDGECFINVIVDKELNETGIAFEILDARLLDVKFNGTNAGRRVVSGIELDKFDRAVAYWFWNKHLNSRMAKGNRKRIRVEALDLSKPGVQGGVIQIHNISDDRANALRGKPWITPAMTFLARLQEYMDAELLAAQVAASAPIFITTDRTDTSAVLGDPMTNTTAAVNASPESGQEQRVKAPLPEVIDFDAATFLKLGPGETPVAPDVRRPNSQLEATVKQYIRGASAALNIAYPTLANDNSDETFSSARMSILIERDHFKRMQDWFARAMLQPLYEAWLRAAMLSETVTLPTKDPNDYLDIEWRGRGFPWVDPLRDAKANAAAIAMGVRTITMTAEEQGLDIDMVIAERKEEIAKFEKAGVETSMDNLNTNTTQVPPDGTTPGEDEE